MFAVIGLIKLAVRRRMLAACALAGCCAVLGACGTNHTGVASIPPTGIAVGSSQPTVVPALPAPGQLKRPSKVVVNVVNGADFNASISLNAAAAGPDASLTPVATATAQSNLAYAAYALEPDVATVQPVLHLAWRIAPQAGQCWVGLGDFTTNVWTWQQWTAGQDIALDLQTKNINTQTGIVPLVVLTTGATAAQLGRIRIGANLPPQPMLTLTAPQGPAPINLTADASGTTDPDGLIVKYEYDLDGDGVIDQTSTQPVMHWQQPLDGSYQVYMRVTDDDGDSGSAVVDYDTGYTHTWAPPSGPTNVQYSSIAASPAGGFLALGFAILPPGGTKLSLVLLKYKADGSLDWVQALGNATESNFPGGIAADLTGGAYITATMTVVAGGGTMMLAHVNANGSLDWQRTWGGTKVYLHNNVAIDYLNGDVYASFSYMTGATHVAVLQSYSTAGQWQWTRGWNGGSDTYGIGTGVDGLSNVYLGMMYQSGGYAQCGAIQYDPSGNQLGKTVTNDATFGLQANALAVNPSGGIALVGEYMDATHWGPFAVVLSSGFSQDYGFFLPVPTNEDSFNCCKFSHVDGRLWACGTLQDMPDFEGALMVFATNGFNHEMYRFDAPGGKTDFFGLDLPVGGGVLIAGDQTGPLQIDPTDRDCQTLPYTLTVPAPDSLPDNSQPQVSTYPSVAVQGNTGGPGGGLVYKFYQPLE